MRTYDVLYNARYEDWSIIAHDEFDDHWFMVDSGLSKSTAQAAVAGYRHQEG